MKKKNKFPSTIYLFITLVFLLTACNSTNNELYTHTIDRTDFIDYITCTGEIEPASTLNITAPSVRSDATISYLIPNGEQVKKGDTICILKASGVENRYQQAATNLENSEAEYNKTKARQNLDLQLLKAKKQTIEASTAIRKLDTIQQKFVSRGQKQIIELELEKADIELQKVNNRLKSLKTINKSELNQKEIMIKQSRNQLKNAKQSLNKLTITAPKGGILLRARSHNGELIGEGDVVWGSHLIAHIPNTSQYQVKFLLSESEYKRIEKGYTYTANPSVNKIVRGKIKRKATMGKPLSRKSKVKQFEVTATVDTLNFEPKPGQTVYCKIQIKKITNATILPLLSIFTEDSIHFIYITRGEKFEKRRVTIAYQNESNAILKESIQSGARVALIKPSKSQILKKNISHE